MKQRKFTLMFIQDANHPIRQAKLPKSILYVIPLTILIILLSTSSWLYHNKMADVHQIQALETQLIYEAETAQTIIEEKDTAITLLQLEIIHLSEQADKVKSKLEQLEQLTEEIKDLSTTVFPNNPLLSVHIEDDPVADGRKTDKLSILSGNKAIGGTSYPATNRDIQALAQITTTHYNALQNELVLILNQLTSVHEALEEVEYIQSITPSIWPSTSRRISSGFGVRSDPFTRKPAFHNGIDFPGSSNDPVYATAGGKVKEAGWNRQFGNYVIINHTRAIQTLYMHLSKTLVDQGDTVGKGDTIGTMGTTGRSTGTHLHYEVHRHGVPVNPNRYLP